MINKWKQKRIERKEDAAYELVSDYLAGRLPAKKATAIQRRLETDREFRDFVEPLLWSWHTAREMQVARQAPIDMEAGWKGFRAAAMKLDPARAALLPETLPTEEPVPYLFPPAKAPTLKERLVRFRARWRELKRTRRRWFQMGVIVLGILIDNHCYGDLIRGRQNLNWQDASAAGGAVQSLGLVDKTSVALAGNSSLHYPAQLDRPVGDGVVKTAQHIVTLQGEAYFAMPANDARLLTVRAGDMSVVSLDGAFDVHAYPHDTVWHVVAVEGHARVELAGRKVTLEKGQEVAVTRKSISAPYPARRALEWRTGVHTYTDTPLGEVLHDLENWYGVRFWYPKSMDRELLPLTVTGKSIDEAIRGLENDTGHRFDRWFNQVLVYR